MRTFVIACLVGMLGVVLFWSPLLTGAGLLGGDILPYYVPQKQFYAESLLAGRLPLWNPRTGFGYPLLGESQTGVLYPPNLILYHLVSVQTAYVANQFLHYILAVVFTVLLAKRLGIGLLGSLLTAVVYVFGWAPPRFCLEWAIIGVMWLPLGVWLVESHLQTGRSRYLLALPFAIGCQLLAGHFNLAFLHLLTLGLWTVGRLFWAKRESDAVASVPAWRVGRHLLIAIVAGVLIAAPQLMATWKLKQSGGQPTVGGAFTPAEGHLPPLYVSQVVASWWYWYSVDTDAALNQLTFLAVDAPTNKVEAHLYFGLIPFGLLCLGLLRRRTDRPHWSRKDLLWLGIGLAFLVYAFGWLIPIGRHLPGFGFFRGPGRYTLVTTLAFAILIGRSFDSLTRAVQPRSRGIIWMIVLLLTTADLWIVSRLQTYVAFVPEPPLTLLEHSPVRKQLTKATLPRVYGPGQNFLNTLGASQFPTYLGLGPAIYFDPEHTIPDDGDGDFHTLSEPQIDWLRNAGVTHLLGWEKLRTPGDPLRLIYSGPDPYLNRNQARHPRANVFLYELKGAPGRVSWTDPVTGPKVQVLQTFSGMSLRFDETQADNELVIRNLAWPGWRYILDRGEPQPIDVGERFIRISVPQGTSSVELDYEPAWWEPMCILSALTMFFAPFALHRLAGRTAISSDKPEPATA